MIPQTAVKVRMGRQAVGLPADAFGKSAIMDATWGTRDGVSLSAPVADWMNLSAFWVRVDGANGDLDQTPNSDAFGVVADLKFDGFSVSPYAMYASIDKAAFGTDSAFGWTSDKPAQSIKCFQKLPHARTMSSAGISMPGFSLNGCLFFLCAMTPCKDSA